MRKYDLQINDRDYEVIIKKVTPADAYVEVNGLEHVVLIKSIENLGLPIINRPAPPPVSPTTPPAYTTPIKATAKGSIISPMPGQIKSIFVREGDRVTIGQKLLIMEAMKLENKIVAKSNGLVKKILVRDGDTVNQGQELVIIE
ncbi:MAG: biotin/lipoyl-containing protein [Thermodesulfobacteriota bacterium]